MLVWTGQPQDDGYGWNTEANCDKGSNIPASNAEYAELDDTNSIDLIFAQESTADPAFLIQLAFNSGLREIGLSPLPTLTHTFKWNYIKDLWELLGASDEMEFVDGYKRGSFSMIYAPWLCDDAFKTKICTESQIIDLYSVDLMQVANSLVWQYDFSNIKPDELACGLFTPTIVPTAKYADGNEEIRISTALIGQFGSQHLQVTVSLADVASITETIHIVFYVSADKKGNSAVSDSLVMKLQPCFDNLCSPQCPIFQELVVKDPDMTVGGYEMTALNSGVNTSTQIAASISLDYYYKATAGDPEMPLDPSCVNENSIKWKLKI